MGLLSRTHKLYRSVNVLQKASPVFVHILMIGGVAAYALIGALVMQKLETKVIHGRTQREANQTAIIPSEMDSHSIRHQRSNERNRREIAQMASNRDCVLRALKVCSLFSVEFQKLIEYDCDSKVRDRMTVRMIEHCYRVTIRNERSLDGVVFRNSDKGVELVGGAEFLEPWSFSDSILFSFTIITTIGYGNIAPQTFGGRLFCILYGFVGIPFTLLAIADLGKFFSELIESWGNLNRRLFRKIRRHLLRKDLSKSVLSLTSVVSKRTTAEELTKLENGNSSLDEEPAPFERKPVDAAFRDARLSPDVIAEPPIAALNFSIRQSPIQIGAILKASALQKPPQINFTADPQLLYTAVMIDPDAPSRRNPVFGQFRHWLVINIPGGNMAAAQTITPYHGPSPPKRSGYHRYVTLVFEQHGRIVDPEVKRIRTNFRVAAFAKRHGFGRSIAGHFYFAKSGV